MKTASPVSLRRRILWLTGGIASILAVALAATLALTHDLGAELDRATDDFAEEQHIADRLGEAVMRQLVAASVYPNHRSDAIRATYDAAGHEAYEHIRSYLVRDLSEEQRFQLEQMREEHQRMEVAAARVFGSAAADRPQEFEAALDALMARALSLQEAVRDFVAMREQDLDRLRHRQTATVRTLYWTGIGLAVLPLFAALFVGGFLQRTVAAPLDQLATATRRIADGDLEARVPVSRFVELGAAAQGFNHMADRLSAAKRILEDRNRQLEEAVAELEATRDELVQSEKLGALGRMMAGLAHELNNPLTSVVGFSELLAERLEGDDRDDAAELVGPLVGEARRAGDLVRNLLHFSRRSASTLQPVSLSATLDVVVGLRAYAFQQSGLSIRVEVDPDMHVLADPQHLQQALLNVVNNAYDAMRPAGQGVLTIRGRRESGMVGPEISLTFLDQGPGLRDPGKVFDPFYTTKPVGEGTGLGLALVHRFMEGFGGRVEARTAPWGGAAFVLHFRPAPGGAEATDMPRLPARDVREDRRTSPLPAEPRVLVVDDEPAIRALQEKMLSRIGARVVVAGGGREARDLLESGVVVDLVVSDVKMPDGDGPDLYRWIRTTRPELAARFIFVTGDVREPAGFEAAPVIRKPFDVEDFIDLVLRTLGGSTSPPVPGDR